MDEDEYEIINKKPLKLNKVQKKKDGKTEIHEDLSHLPKIPDDPDKVIITTSTKAEEAFRSKQEKIAEDRILKKATKTHKQRVEEFNKHLDSLSEHYDIPKVSWTK